MDDQNPNQESGYCNTSEALIVSLSRHYFPPWRIPLFWLLTPETSFACFWTFCNTSIQYVLLYLISYAQGSMGIWWCYITMLYIKCISGMSWCGWILSFWKGVDLCEWTGFGIMRLIPTFLKKLKSFSEYLSLLPL